jgi:hypothetical protein
MWRIEDYLFPPEPNSWESLLQNFNGQPCCLGRNHCILKQVCSMTPSSLDIWCWYYFRGYKILLNIISMVEINKVCLNGRWKLNKTAHDILPFILHSHAFEAAGLTPTSITQVCSAASWCVMLILVDSCQSVSHTHSSQFSFELHVSAHCGHHQVRVHVQSHCAGTIIYSFLNVVSMTSNMYLNLMIATLGWNMFERKLWVC